MNSPETEKESESAPTFEMRNTQRQNKKIKKICICIEPETHNQSILIFCIFFLYFQMLTYQPRYIYIFNLRFLDILTFWYFDILIYWHNAI